MEDEVGAIVRTNLGSVVKVANRRGTVSPFRGRNKKMPTKTPNGNDMLGHICVTFLFVVFFFEGKFDNSDFGRSEAGAVWLKMSTGEAFYREREKTNPPEGL